MAASTRVKPGRFTAVVVVGVFYAVTVGLNLNCLCCCCSSCCCVVFDVGVVAAAVEVDDIAVVVVDIESVVEVDSVIDVAGACVATV